MDINIMDAISGRALVDKTSADARSLIENMSINSQQFTTRINSMVLTKKVNEIQAINNKNLVSRLNELTTLVKNMAVCQTQRTRVCGIYTSTEYATDAYMF